MSKGRKRVEIDKANFEGLLRIQCTEEEISQVLGVSIDTISRWIKREYNGATYPEIRDKFSALGKVSLRRIQFAHAKKSPAMAIFLGKQYLGQKDVAKSEVTCEDLGCLADMLKLDDEDT